MLSRLVQNDFTRTRGRVVVVAAWARRADARSRGVDERTCLDMGSLCSCCSASSAYDEAEEALMTERDATARRKAADAALLRVGNMAKRLRPQSKPQKPRSPATYGDGMRWTAG